MYTQILIQPKESFLWIPVQCTVYSHQFSNYRRLLLSLREFIQPGSHNSQPDLSVNYLYCELTPQGLINLLNVFLSGFFRACMQT